MTRLHSLPRAARQSRWPLAVLLATLLAVLGAVVVAPPAPARAADTPTGNCAFRTSTAGSVSEKLAPQLCWLDFTGLQAVTTPQNFSLKVGAYTLSFTVTISGNPADSGGPSVTTENVPSWYAKGVFSNTLATGEANFIPLAGDTQQPIIRHNAGRIASANDFMRFTFGNIKLTHTATGTAMSNFQLVVAEAETTTAGEGLTVNNGDATYATPPVQYLTPATGYTQACNRTAGVAYESATTADPIGMAPMLQRDFVCEGDQSGPGSWLATVDKPSTLQVTSYSLGANQAFALAIPLGRAGATVKADTSAYGAAPAAQYERTLTGAETTFGMAVWNDVSTSGSPFIRIPGTAPAIGPQDGSKETYLRQRDPSGQATDLLYFESSGTNVPGGDASLVFKRYTPVWTCQEGTGASFTLPTSGKAATYTQADTAATGKSRVTVTNPTNVPIRCDVYWKSNFATAAVNLSKDVTGTASGFPEVQLRTYDLSYTCTLAGYLDAYPTGTLSGKVTVSRGGSAQVLTLPKGAVCTFTESFPQNPDGTTPPPALPGKALTVTWGPSPTVTGTWDSFDATHAALPAKTATLGASNTISATNEYDYRGGTVDVTKVVQGAPVPELANTTRTYDFSWGCAGTNRGGSFSVTVTYAADGTASGTLGTRLVDVPVARDCWIRPLTGLSAAESARITFDGRVVNASGTVTSPGAITAQAGDYHFQLQDYRDLDTPQQITSLDANGVGISHATLAITATYSYKTADVKVLKQVTGSAAQRARDEFGLTTAFPVNYACSYGLNGGQVRQGTVQATLDAANPVVIPGVPVGASCRIWEDVSAALQGTNVRLVGTGADGHAATTVQGTDANDVSTVLPNDLAQTSVVQVVHDSSDVTHNRVVVTNVYEPRVGTVTLSKMVDKGGVSLTLPNTFTFDVDCGARTVRRADGSYVSVPLQGTVTVDGGQSTTLRLSNGDAELQQLIDDQAGNLGVPYGNTCTFAERPVALPAGVLLASDAAARSVTVTAPSTTSTITNTFSAAGAGLTIRRSASGSTVLSQPVSYHLACTNAGSSVPLTAQYADFTLSNATPSITIPSGALPQGSVCTLTDTDRDPGTRTSGSVTYPITRSTTADMAADGSNPALHQTFTATTATPVAPVSVTNITIGAQSVLTLNDSYELVEKPITVSKVVAFDAATQQWISEARKEVKRNRLFTVDIACTEPGTGQTRAASVQVSATTTSLAGVTASLGSQAVGSTCIVTEGETTTAPGVRVDRQVQVNGGASSSVSASFTVAATANDVVVTNTYTRNLATVQLNKVAVLPPNLDIAGEYGGLDKVPFHTHQFTMTCRDPFDGSVFSSTFAGTITGANSLVLHDVPAQVECSFVGDNFGSLDLATTAADGTPLETHLRDARVDWVVDKNDGNTVTVDPAAGAPAGTVASPWFSTLPDAADGTPGTIVDLKNFYEMAMTQLQLHKYVVATRAGMDLLAAAAPTYRFSYSCEGVGYRQWVAPSLGSPFDVAYSSFGPGVSNGDANPETFTQTWDSPMLNVPAGAWCTLTEQQGSPVPNELSLSVRPDTTVAQRAPGGSDLDAGPDMSLTNRYTRRTVPVRFAMMQAGYLAGADPAGYSMRVTCDDPRGFDETVSVPLADVLPLESVADPGAPDSGEEFLLPVASTCTLSLVGSPALAARPVLEVTQGERTPFVQFGLWDGTGQASPTNVTLPPAELPVDDAHITSSMKAYTYTFSLPSDITVPAGRDVAMTVGAEAIHPQDTVTLTLSKTALGTVAAGASFLFTASCVPGEATFKAGEVASFPGVKVGSSCIISEVDDGVAGSEAVLSVAQAGSNLTIGQVVNTPAHGSTAGEHTVTVGVDPVSLATDPSTTGAPWRLDLVNTYPSIHLTKTIAGGPLSTVTAPLADTAVLSQGATTMEVTYTIVNNGGLTATGIALTDPGMVGRTLHRDGVADVVVGSDGVIPLTFCGLSNSLVPGAEAACTFSASIDEPVGTWARIPVEAATVSASANGTVVTSASAFGALRPVVGVLPETGVQTLVWALAAGLILLVVGVWQYRRGDDEG